MLMIAGVALLIACKQQRATQTEPLCILQALLYLWTRRLWLFSLLEPAAQ